MRSISVNFSALTSPLRFTYGVDGNHGPECDTHVSVAEEELPRLASSLRPRRSCASVTPAVASPSNLTVLVGRDERGDVSRPC